MCVEQLPQMYAIARSPSGLLLKAIWWWPFFLGPVFTLLIVMALATLPYGFSWRNIGRNMRFLILLSAVFVIGLILESPFFPHYAAPTTAIILLFAIQAMRRLQSWRPRGRPAGLFVTRTILPICIIMFVLRAAAGPRLLDLENGSIT